MIVFSKKMLRSYAETDPLLSLMDEFAIDHDETFTSHRWLKDSLPKRLIYFHMYGDILEISHHCKKVLDIGGGFTSLTRKMLENHDYKLIDIMAHDDHEMFRAIEKSVDRTFWVNDDWYNWKSDCEYDVVIANDLFPNVDQRLGIFLEKYIPLARELRISLTYYNNPRWYRVRRTDGDEIFHMMALSGKQTASILEPFISFIKNPCFEQLSVDRPSLFPNGRHVCMVVIKKGV